jgi:hypothetical protein
MTPPGETRAGKRGLSPLEEDFQADLLLAASADAGNLAEGRRSDGRIRVRWRLSVCHIE